MRVRILVFIGAVVLTGFAFSEDMLHMSVNMAAKTNEHSSHDILDAKYQGLWNKKLGFRPRWVKTWQNKKMYVSLWKHIYGPVEVKESVPVPKAQPGWVKLKPGTYLVKFPQ